MASLGDHRTTPASVIDVVREFREIGVDPAWNPSAVHRPRVVYDGGRLGDGLRESWATRPGECVWVNGTWSALVPWARSAVGEHIRHGAEILFWGPVYPETDWAKLLYPQASAVCLWSKRVHHPLPPGVEAEVNARRAEEGKSPLGKGSMWPTQLIYLGGAVDEFARHFEPHGTVMFLERGRAT